MGKQLSFDCALICKAGHVANIYKSLHPECNSEHCLLCPEEIISECPSCHTPIRGGYYSLAIYSNMARVGDYSGQTHTTTHYQELTKSDEYQVPAYCHKCGAPYPWTAEMLRYGERIVEALDDLPPEKKAQLKSLFPDLIVETPRSQLAVLELGKALDAIQCFGKEIFINWLSQNMAPVLYALLQSLKLQLLHLVQALLFKSAITAELAFANS